MKIQQFLQHHQIARNPFAEEDAQTDPVFKEHCIDSTYHPNWDKVYGDPAEPATSVVFGEKGSGKTAMRLQIARHLREYNRKHPEKRVFVVQYDDFNPFLDRFREKLGQRKQRADKALSQWHLWDHIDAILSLSVTGIVDRILAVRSPTPMVEAEIEEEKVAQLDRSQTRDLLLMAACYDLSTTETARQRWGKLRKKLKFSVWKSFWAWGVGIGVSVLWLILAISLLANVKGSWLGPWWLSVLVLIAAWAPLGWRAARRFVLARGIVKRLRVGNHETNPLRRIFMNFSAEELLSQPLPNKDRTDDRFEILAKLQGILQTLGYTGIVVLVDRVDEPHLINGSAELMKLLLWPMLDNKFLKHPGLGVKLMLPIELTRFIEREERDFYQRARLDKQNMVPNFQWTGEALLDVADARVSACAEPGASPKFRDLFAPGLSDQRLLEGMRSVRVPRHLFKLMYRILVAHCNAHTDSAPKWQISPETFETALAVYLRDQDAFDRGMGAG